MPFRVDRRPKRMNKVAFSVNVDKALQTEQISILFYISQVNPSPLYGPPWDPCSLGEVFPVLQLSGTQEAQMIIWKCAGTGNENKTKWRQIFCERRFLQKTMDFLPLAIAYTVVFVILSYVALVGGSSFHQGGIIFVVKKSFDQGKLAVVQPSEKMSCLQVAVCWSYVRLYFCFSSGIG